MNIFLRELRFFRFQTVLWTSIIVFVVVFYLSIYPTFYQSKEEFTEILNNFPKEVLEALNVDGDRLFTPLGYYCFTFSYIVIIGAFQAGVLGLKVMLGDTLEKANSFILTKPVSRKKILTSKLCAAIASLVITNIIFQIFSFLVMMMINNSEGIIWYQLFLINLALLLIQLTFVSITMMIGGFIKKPKAVTITAVISIIVFYVLSILQELTDLEFLRYLNPFSYFKVDDILVTGGYKSGFIVASIFITFFCVNFGYIHYDTSDVLGG